MTNRRAKSGSGEKGQPRQAQEKVGEENSPTDARAVIVNTPRNSTVFFIFSPYRLSNIVRAEVSLAGPLAGLLASIACAVMWWTTDSPFWAALARSSEPAALAACSECRSTSMCKVLRDGQRVELRLRGFDLLAALMRHPGRVFARVELLRQVRGYRSAVGLEPSTFKSRNSAVRSNEIQITRAVLCRFRGADRFEP